MRLIPILSDFKRRGIASLCLMFLCSLTLVAAQDADATASLLYQGKYEAVIERHDAPVAMKIQAQLSLGRYQHIIEVYAEAEDWHQRSALAAAYRQTGGHVALDELVGLAMQAQKQRAGLSASDLCGIAEIIGERDIKLAWGLVQAAHAADANYQHAYVVGARIAIAAFAWNFVLDESTALMRLNKAQVEGQTLAAKAIVADNKFPQAKSILEEALKKNPRYIPALNLLALLALQQRKTEQMHLYLKRALAVNPAHNKTLALCAAAADMEQDFDKRDAFIEKATSANTQAHEVYALMAEAAERRYRYEEALAWGERAQKANPTHWQGDYIVAVNLLRLGEEPRGYALMDQSFKKNGFNVWAYNMLSILDEDFKRQLYVQHETEYFALKIPKTIDAQLWPYLERWLDPLFESMQERYAFTPTGPEAYNKKILLLFFDDHGRFSARTVGLPGLGANGATFGQVITMPMVDRDSIQRAHPWYSTLEHEIAHVFTIQKTKRRIPRWFTEGISEWQERESHVNLDDILVRTIADKELPSLEHMSDGIHYPKFAMQISLYYYLSSLVIDFLIAEHGPEVLNKILDDLANDVSMVAALEKHCAKDLATIDADYHRYVTTFAQQIHSVKRYSPEDLKAMTALHQKSAFVGIELLQYAEALAQHGQVGLAQRIASGLVNDAELGTDAQIMQAKIALLFARNAPEALSILSLILALDEEHVIASWWAMQAALQDKDEDSAAIHAETAMQGMPRYTRGDQAPPNVLQKIYSYTGDQDAELRVLRKQLAQDDFYYPAQRRYALLLYQRQDWAQAYSALDRCVQFSIYDAHIHAAIGHCQEQLGEADKARICYKIALQLDETESIAEAGLERLKQD